MNEFSLMPVAEEGLNLLDEVLEVGGFDEVGAGVEAVGLLDVADVVGGAEDDDRNEFEAGVGFHSADDVESGEAGHVEVGDDDVGDRVFLALEIEHCFSAVGAGDELGPDLVVLEGFFRQ